MFKQKDFEKSKNIFSHVGKDFYQESNGNHHIYLRPKDLLKWIELAKIDLEYLTLIEIVGVDRSLMDKDGFRFELVYHLLNMGNHQRLNLHVYYNSGEIIPSIVSFFPHAEWMEREQQEMLDVTFSQKHDSLLLPKNQTCFPIKKDSNQMSWPEELSQELPVIRKNPNKSELPFPEESYEWKKYDLTNAQTLGLFEWTVCFDPKKVVNSYPNIGFHHQGLEKFLENKNWLQVLQLVDFLDSGSAPTYSIAWVRNLEEMLDISLTERAQAIRIVMLELARIAEHLTVLFETTAVLNLDEARLFINAREKIYELFEKYCGHRQGMGIAKLGGLRNDLPHGWIIEYQTVASMLSKNLKLIHRSLISQRTFREKLEGPSINAQTILQWGISGPAMRAAGLNFDLRKSRPFYFYQDIDFDIPVGIHGSAYDRYLIRYEEIHQSLRIITQVMDNLPLGEVAGQSIQEDFLRLNESFQKNELITEWSYSSLESPNGEAGIAVMFNQDFSPYRIKIKSPSFVLTQALSDLVLGLEEEQLRPALATIGIRRFELDR